MADPDLFEHYQVLKRPDGSLDELGRGAMGVTYRALDTRLQRIVALKVIRGPHLASETARARFIREAREAAKLRTSNVVEIYHFGELAGACFYAMELVEGETLHQHVSRRGAMGIWSWLSMAEQIARALAATEHLNLIHRDIKPSNIMLRESADGDVEVKLIDFGLAKQALPSDKDTAGPVTVDGFVGTPLVASPEQLEEAPLDIRSDIYSLGVTLWYALAGHYPFVGSTASVISQHLTAPPPIHTLADRPAPIRNLLRRMLAKEPANRHQTAAELRKDIQACRENLRAAAIAATHDGVAGAARSPAPSAAANRQPPAAEQTFNLQFPGSAPAAHPHGPLSPANLIENQPLSGFSLLELLKSRRRLPLTELQPILDQLARAADHALETGLPALDLRLAAVFVHFPGGAAETELERLRESPTLCWPSFFVRVRPAAPAQRPRISGDLMQTIVPEAHDSLITATTTTAFIPTRDDYLFRLAGLAYEMLGGRLSGSQYRVLAALDERGNAILAAALARRSNLDRCCALCVALAETGRSTATSLPQANAPAAAQSGAHQKSAMAASAADSASPTPSWDTPAVRAAIVASALLCFVALLVVILNFNALAARILHLLGPR